MGEWKGGVREVLSNHLPCLEPFVAGCFRGVKGGGEVFSLVSPKKRNGAPGCRNTALG